MKEIVNRLHDNRQIQLAKSILESHGYKVSRVDEALITDYIPEVVLEFMFNEHGYSRLEYEQGNIVKASKLPILGDSERHTFKIIRNDDSDYEVLDSQYRKVFTITDDDIAQAEKFSNLRTSRKEFLTQDDIVSASSLRNTIYKDCGCADYVLPYYQAGKKLLAGGDADTLINSNVSELAELGSKYQQASPGSRKDIMREIISTYENTLLPVLVAMEKVKAGRSSAGTVILKPIDKEYLLSNITGIDKILGKRSYKWFY